jgi:hypothetical protein
MKPENKDAKLSFLRLKLELANDVSKDIESAKNYLKEEGLNVEKTIADGLQRIKQIQMRVNASKTSKEMDDIEKSKQEAIEWVDRLLAEKNISMSELLEKEEVVMSFRNLEHLSEDDKRSLLIKHFMLKINEGKNKK